MVPFNYISVLIMPTDFCNLNCVYCFNDNRTKDSSKKMSISTLKKVFEIIIPYYETVTFIWHGGEPTTLGMDFYKAVKYYQRDLVKKKEENNGICKVRNIMQSNLTLLDEEYVNFFIENEFSIGGSYDGLNNELTRGCSDQILRGHRLIVENGGKNSLINVISMYNIDSLIQDYEWYKDKGISYTTNVYISSAPVRDDLFVPEELYIKKFTEFFDYWLNDTKCNIHIRYFETILKHIIFNHNSMCAYTSCLGKWIGVHYNGDIFPCNRNFPKKYWYGNIGDYNNIKECFESEGFLRLTAEAVQRRKKCAKCDIYSFCAGGCNSNALVFGGIENNNHYCCRILIPMYNYIKRAVLEIMDLPEKNRLQYNPVLINMIKEREETQI